VGMTTDPKLYANSQARFDTVVGTHDFFEMLKKMRVEFDRRVICGSSLHYEFDIDIFNRYIEEHYGIRLLMQEDKMFVAEDHIIVDEDKYLLARLKFA
jgi:hypothetical protein